MFSFFSRKKETPPADDIEKEYHIVEDKDTDEYPTNNSLYPSPYPEHLVPPAIPTLPPASPVLTKQNSITHILQDVPFRLSKQFTGPDYTMALIKAKDILMYINRSAEKSSQYKYDFNVEKSVMNERSE